jgi:hypothetical protein
MSTIINATTTNGVVIQPDNSGSLVLQTNNGTTALTISTAQNATFAGSVTANSITATNTVVMGSSFLRNRIINGDMRIDQRNSGASLTPTTDGQYTLDRFQVYISQSSKFSVQQNAGSVTPPAGFNYYAGITSLSSYTVGTNDYFCFVQNIEGYNIGDFAWGTANAKAITISFWVRSSLTGTFGGSIRNGAANYSYPFTYTISSANTWEQKTVNITAPTSGTWTSTNTSGLQLILGLGVGTANSGTAGAWTGSSVLSVTSSTSIVGTNGATFYITGVQLEVGSTATPFERRLYNQELANCYRYCKSIGDALAGVANSANNWYFTMPFDIPMRASPSFTVTNSTIKIGNYYSADYISSGSTISLTRTSQYGASGILTGWTGLTTGVAYSAWGNTNGYFLIVSAEL